VCRGHTSYITHLDFSHDSKVLQSNCGAYELLFWNVETGQQIKSATSVRDVSWATWSCVLGWPVQVRPFVRRLFPGVHTPGGRLG
jgi:WD40 repeat protein